MTVEHRATPDPPAKPPASPRPRIFLSTVSREFRSLRAEIAKVVRHLGYDPVSMDDWSAAHGELRSWLRRQLETCDGIIHLAGLAYGAEPDDHAPAAHGLPDDTPRYSYTQYEWHYAQAIGLKSWLILPGPACTRDTAPDQLDIPEDSAHPEPVSYQNERRLWQAEHIARLKARNHIHHQPADDHELHKLLDSLHDHAAEMREKFGQWQGFVSEYLARMSRKVDHVQRDTRSLRKAALFGMAALVLVTGGVYLIWEQTRQTGQDIEQTRNEITEIKDIYAKERKLMALILGRSNKRLKDWPDMPPAKRFELALEEIAADQEIPLRELRDMLDLYVARVEADPDAGAEDKYYVLMRRQAFGDAAQLARSEAGNAEQRMRQHAARKDAAQALARQVAAQEDEERRRAMDFYSMEGSASFAAAKYEDALIAHQKAAALVDKEAEPVMWAEVQNMAALVLLELARYSEAEPLVEEVARIRSEHIGPDAPETVTSLSHLAIILHATNKLTEAEMVMKMVLLLDEENHGKDHPAVARDLNDLARVLQDMNRLPEAEPLYLKALSIDEVAYGPWHPVVARDLINLATLYQATNRLAEAEPLMRRALEINEARFGASHPSVAIILNNLAGLLKATNRLAEAEPLYRRALAIDEAIYGPENPTLARGLNNLASLLHDTNRLAEAEPLMRQALATNEASYEPDHPIIASNLNNLARLLQTTRRLAEAEPLMRRAVKILLIFQARNGHPHPQRENAIGNYTHLLQDMNVPEAGIAARMRELEAEARAEAGR